LLLLLFSLLMMKVVMTAMTTATATMNRSCEKDKGTYRSFI
jgi:hypothetical protein